VTLSDSGHDARRDEGSHPDRDDPPGARVRALSRRRSSEEVLPTRSIGVDRSPDHIPHGREALPFVEQHWPLVGRDDQRVGGDHRLFARNDSPLTQAALRISCCLRYG